MEGIKKTNGTFVAKVHSVYNCETEVYEKQKDKNIKPKRNERSIAVRCYRKKISYRIFARKVVCTFVKLHIQDLNRSVRIDITNFLESQFKGQKINSKLLSMIKTKISKEILVKCTKGVWKIVDYDNLLIK